jgi:hypothetical protein
MCMWERYVGSQAAAVLIRRLYVLTWIPAWCGVFFHLSCGHYGHLYHLPCVIYEVLCISIPLTAESIGTIR